MSSKPTYSIQGNEFESLTEAAKYGLLSYSGSKKVNQITSTAAGVDGRIMMTVEEQTELIAVAKTIGLGLPLIADGPLDANVFLRKLCSVFEMNLEQRYQLIELNKRRTIMTASFRIIVFLAVLVISGYAFASCWR